jgi:hypothetical protein
VNPEVYADILVRTPDWRIAEVSSIDPLYDTELP